MLTKQINLTVPENLLEKAEMYANAYGFRNVQELAAEALREKIFEGNFDESLTEKEIRSIEKLLEFSISKGRIKTEKEILKALGD